MQLTKSVALIGPLCAGKTTLSQLMGKFFNLPVIHTDFDKEQYFVEKEFNKKHAENILKENGLKAYYNYLKEFEYDYITSSLTLSSNPCIYDFGAGLVCFEEILKKNEIIKLLKKFNYVLLILPHKDQKTSYELIYDRLIIRSENDKQLFNYVIDNNFDLIKHSIEMFQDISHNVKVKKIFTSHSIKNSLLRIINYLL